MKLFLLFLLLFAYINVHQSKPLNKDHVTSEVINEEEIGIVREDESDDVTDRDDDVTDDESGEGSGTSGAKKDEIPKTKENESTQGEAVVAVESKEKSVKLRKKRSSTASKRDEEEKCHHEKCCGHHHCDGHHDCCEHEHCHGNDEGHHDNDHHHKHDHGYEFYEEWGDEGGHQGECCHDDHGCHEHHHEHEHDHDHCHEHEHHCHHEHDKGDDDDDKKKSKICKCKD